MLFLTPQQLKALHGLNTLYAGCVESVVLTRAYAKPLRVVAGFWLLNGVYKEVTIDEAGNTR